MAHEIYIFMNSMNLSSTLSRLNTSRITLQRGFYLISDILITISVFKKG